MEADESDVAAVGTERDSVDGTVDTGDFGDVAAGRVDGIDLVVRRLVIRLAHAVRGEVDSWSRRATRRCPTR
jgi:hypothetical protein